jgi:NTE family protein
MDGGMRSSANADLAAGAEHVLILVPKPETSSRGPAIPAVELDALGDARVDMRSCRRS